MSNKLSQAAADVLNLAKPFKALIELAEAVESIDGLENVEATKRKAIAELDAEIAEKRESVSLLNAQGEEALARIEEAKQAAAANVGDAARAAQDIVAKASAEADAIIAAANEKVAGLEGKVASLEADCNTLTLEKTKLEQQYLDADAALKAKKDEIRAIAG